MPIAHMIVCNFCGNTTEIPDRCEEDDAFYKLEKASPDGCKVYGISIESKMDVIKSYEQYRRGKKDNTNLTFCNKNCYIEYIRKNMNDEGKMKA